MDRESRRASCHYALYDAGGKETRAGEATAVIDDDGLTAGAARVQFLDAESLTASTWSIESGLYPSGKLVLSQLGRRFETFRDEMIATRDRARLGGMLAHGIERPVEFRGAWIAERDVAATLLVFPTHLAVIPAEGDPFQIPLGTVRRIYQDESSCRVVVETMAGSAVFGQLARQTEAFARALNNTYGVISEQFATLTDSPDFADGLGVPRENPDLDRLLGRWSSQERLDGARELVRRATAPTRIGLVTILDPDAESIQAIDPLPENIAAFLLVPVHNLVVLEIVSGPGAATYVFEGDIERINRDLQELHFRRRPLAFTESQLQSADALPYRLAFRRLEPLKRLRAATRARVIHNDDWSKAIGKAIE